MGLASKKEEAQTIVTKKGETLTIEAKPSPNSFSNLVRSQFGEPIKLIAKDKSGAEVGRLVYMPDGGPIDVFVSENKRRQGIGNALYDAFEKQGGKLPSINSGVAISDEARALRSSREYAPLAGLDDIDTLFKTSRGSTYAYHTNKTSTRNRSGEQHTDKTTGIQPRSGKTVFMSNDDVNRVAGIFQNTEMATQLVPVLDEKGRPTGKAKLELLEDYGPRKKGSTLITVSYTTTPEVGLAPVEIYRSESKMGDSGRGIHFGTPITEVINKPVRAAGKAGLMAAALGASSGASASEIAESFLPLALTPSTLAPGTLTPEQKAEADAANQRKLEEEAAAREKAQALLRSGVVRDETKMAKGGMMKPRIPGFQDGGNANEAPIGALPKEVADDVPAQLSEGEFVVPADVVRFIGLERLMKMRDEAKAGLQRMAEIGQMGNAEAVGEKADDSFEEEEEDDDEDEGFASTIDGIMSEMDTEEQTQQAFAKGGAVGGPEWLTGYDMKKAPKNPVFDVRYFKHSDGRMMYVTFYNGRPMTPIPDGFTETEGPTEQQVGKEAEEKKKETPAPAPEPSEGVSAEDVGAQPATTPTPSIPGTLLGFTPMQVQKGAEMLGKVPTIATKALSFIGKNLSDTLAQEATAASMQAVQAEAEAQAPSSPASMGGMAASNAAVAAADASIAAGHSNAASIAAANAAAAAINSGASPAEAATAGATAAAATDAGVSIGGQPGMEGISDVGGPGVSADADSGVGPGVGDAVSGVTGDDGVGVYAKGGMVQRRKQPAKKQKKKGLASR